MGHNKAATVPQNKFRHGFQLSAPMLQICFKVENIYYFKKMLSCTKQYEKYYNYTFLYIFTLSFELKIKFFGVRALSEQNLQTPNEENAESWKPRKPVMTQQSTYKESNHINFERKLKMQIVVYESNINMSFSKQNKFSKYLDQ
eukprot:TRINITY_DN2750_c3_g1_i8.p4 TRINITY_DN2750_c3_g1~~TRINITY_DN2750_c3_g1_i8.p4  ORF type:complete len:144 (+),score=1.31 TRINITY_DN2750_c3_g1_i8:358-789(+)